MLKKTGLLILVAAILFACNNDDDLIAACDAVTNVSSNSVTNNSAILTWDDSNTTALFSIEYGVSGFSLGGGTSISVSETNLSLLGLSASTTYDVY
ncbi:MAG: DMSO reductase anchor subunit, partial [Psychroserpens sp.]